MSLVAIGIPTYNHVLNPQIISSIFNAIERGSQNTIHSVHITSTSAWVMQLNEHLIRAKELRKEGVTHFLYLHADCAPQTIYWLDTILSEMEALKKDALSVSDEIGAMPLSACLLINLSSSWVDEIDWETQEYITSECAVAHPEDFVFLDKIKILKGSWGLSNIEVKIFNNIGRSNR